MISPIKILVVAALGYLAWKAWRRIGPMLADGAPKAPPKRQVEELAVCPTCGVYVAAAAPPCERADCPRS